MTATAAMTMTDSELRTICFGTLVDKVGYLGAERFVVIMNRDPNEYTEWRKISLPKKTRPLMSSEKRSVGIPKPVGEIGFGSVIFNLQHETKGTSRL